MVTEKQELNAKLSPALVGVLNASALLLLAMIGAILFFASPASVQTSPNLRHNIVDSSEKTNAPHFSPQRNLLPPEGMEGTLAGRYMAPCRHLTAP